MNEKAKSLVALVRRYRVVFRISLIVFIAAIILCVVESAAIMMSAGGFRNALVTSFGNMSTVIGLSGAVSVVYIVTKFVSQKLNVWEEDQAEEEKPKASADELKAAAAKLGAKPKAAKSDKN